MVQVANILTISSATSKRPFSAMRQINTYILEIYNGIMDQDRFSNLFILIIEKDVEIDPETFLEQFISIKKKKNESLSLVTFGEMLRRVYSLPKILC